jgi:hypothetical protein
MKTSQDTGMIDTSLFPHQDFPVRLEIPQENRIAWFSDDYQLQKYLSRVKLKPKDIKVLYRDEKPTRDRKVNKNSVQSRPTKKDSRGTSRNRRNTEDLDSGGTVSGTRKSKSKK